ncbi:MAG: hypothetical protein CVV03_06005 [Firmicutes bacterium HGW-Firmicutes-8]|nr:MAG: hypothetical protein CVV03_06005 [Firmicutes bacterium HGW-Firmicutes-8]
MHSYRSIHQYIKISRRFIISLRKQYYRISIPDLLDENIQKVIYLDSDIIVTTDITNLWNINIDHYLLPGFPPKHNEAVIKKA